MYTYVSFQNSEYLDKLTAAETEAAELKNNMEEIEFNLESASHKVDKYDRHLAEAMQKLKTLEEGDVHVKGGGEGVSKRKVSAGIDGLAQDCSNSSAVALELLQSCA